MATGQGLHQSISNKAKGDAFGDAETAERHHHDGEKRGDGLGGIVPADAHHRRHHKTANDDQRRRYDRIELQLEAGTVGHDHGVGHGRADHFDQRGKQQRKQQQYPGDDIGKAGPASGRDSGRTFDVAGDGGGAQQRSDHCAGGIGAQGFPGARQPAVFDKSGLFAHADQRAHGIKKIQNEKRKDDADHPEINGAEQIEFEKGGRHGRGRRHHPLKPGEAEGQRRRCRNQDGDQYRTAHLQGQKRCHEDQSEQSEKHRRAVQVAETHQSAGRIHHDAGPLQTDQRNQKADADGDAVFQ